MLKCGLHKCPSSCHQLFDHTKILCKIVLTQKCSAGHKQSWRCHAGSPSSCSQCEREKKEAEKKVRRDFEEKQKRDEMIQKHLKEVAKIDEEIAKTVQSMKDARLNTEQQAVLAQKRADLATAKERANRKTSPHQDASPAVNNNDGERNFRTFFSGVGSGVLRHHFMSKDKRFLELHDHS